MSEINTGGPAFPVPDQGGAEWGMTLRDYFAAKAMQGYMVNVEEPNYHRMAMVSYRMADAMLEAREQ